MANDDVAKLFEETSKFFTDKPKYVISFFDIKQLEIGDFCDDYGRIRLVTLFGDSHGNLAWHTNSYSDGSGTYDVMRFETIYHSIGDAKEALKKKILDCDDWVYSRAVEKAEEYGIELPKDRLEKFYSARIERENLEVEKLKEQIAERTERTKEYKSKYEKL